MVKGIEFEFANGEKMVIPPLSLGSLEVVQEDLSSFDGSMNSKSVGAVVHAVHLALQRNYPDMTADRVKNELLDLSNMGEVMQAVMDVGGLLRKAQEAKDAGELKPVME